MKLIINADDFGVSKSVNNAIIQSFQENLVSSSTIMVNMPGFDEACKLINEHNLYGRIGIHINLTAGYPITKRMSLCRKFCDGSGKFNSQRNKLFWLDKEEKWTVYDEFQGQLNRLLDRKIVPTHIDSHHHYHTEWAIGKQALKIAQKNDIKSIRLTRNCGKGISKIKRIYKNVYNYNLTSRGFSRVGYFGSVDDVMKINKPELYNIEIMVHPGFDKRGRLIDLLENEELRFLIGNIKFMFPKHDLSSY